MKVYIILLFTCVLLLASCSSSTAPTSQVVNSNIEFGIPTDGTQADDYLIERYQYTLSYNNGRGGPNWVSWNVDADWYGDAERFDGDFNTDPLLPSNYTLVTPATYTNSPALFMNCRIGEVEIPDIKTERKFSTRSNSNLYCETRKLSTAFR